MDIFAYEHLIEGLSEYNKLEGKPYGNVVVPYRTTNTTYPHTVIGEIRNISTNFNSDFDRVASVGYSVRIYAKNKGKFTKEMIAREIAKMCDDFLSRLKLSRVSYNADESISDNSIYEIVLTYSGNLHENRRKFI